MLQYAFEAGFRTTASLFVHRPRGAWQCGVAGITSTRSVYDRGAMPSLGRMLRLKHLLKQSAGL
jgi:hypothetical protein